MEVVVVERSQFQCCSNYGVDGVHLDTLAHCHASGCVVVVLCVFRAGAHACLQEDRGAVLCQPTKRVGSIVVGRVVKGNGHWCQAI